MFDNPWQLRVVEDLFLKAWVLLPLMPWVLQNTFENRSKNAEALIMFRKFFHGFLASLVVLASSGTIAGDVEQQVATDLWQGTQDSSVADSRLHELQVMQTPQGWFEVVALPGDVYGFMEHGHSERVNSFWILGEKKDILYDTGMGISSIKAAIDFIRKKEGLPNHEIVVLNSHAHLDHIGGNAEFDTVHMLEDAWTIRTVSAGINAGEWVEYYGALLPDPAPQPPVGFDPRTHAVKGLSKDKLRFLTDGELIDLGNRQIRVIKSSSHTSADLLLHDAKQQLLFTGDAFTPISFLVSDLKRFEQDVEIMANLSVKYHFNTHGPLLIDLSWRQRVLNAMREINGGGEFQRTTTSLLGMQLPTYSAGDVKNIVYAVDLLSLFP